MKSKNITLYTSVFILLILFVRLVYIFMETPNEIFDAIYLSFILICFMFIFILDISWIKLIIIPLICSVFIFISAAVNGFEGNRGAIFISFIGQLFTMYVFTTLPFKESRVAFKIIRGYTFLLGFIAIFMIMAGIQKFHGLNSYSLYNGVLRNVRGILSNHAYLGYFSSFIIAVMILSGKYDFKKSLIIIYLLILIVFSSSRESLVGVFIVSLLHIVTRKYRTPILKFITIFIFGIFALILVYGWLASPYNFKSLDSGRLLLYYSAINVVKDNILFGTGMSVTILKSTALQEVHNFFLSSWGQYGIFVVITYVVYFFWFFVNSGRRGRILLTYQFFSLFTNATFMVGFPAMFFVVILLTTYLNHLDKIESEEVLEAT